MKLSDWARKQGIAYLTAYRWFKDNKLPVKAYQTESGTIIVEDEEVLEMSPSVDSSGIDSADVMSLFLRKTVEFSKNDASVEDFAAWVISTFSLNFFSSETKPKYSRLKPPASQVMERYSKMINKGEKPKAQMFIPNNPKDLDKLIDNDENLSAQDLIDGLADLNCALIKTEPVDGVAVPVDEQLFKDLSIALKSGPTSSSIGSTSAGIFTRIDTTPQNYADSTVTSNSLTLSDELSSFFEEKNGVNCVVPKSETTDFIPTEKEVEGAKSLINTRSVNIKSKRGRGRPKKS